MNGFVNESQCMRKMEDVSLRMPSQVPENLLTNASVFLGVSVEGEFHLDLRI